jgi:hypothetical protein
VALPSWNEGARRAARALSPHRLAGVVPGTKGAFRAASRVARPGACRLPARPCRPSAGAARGARATHLLASRLTSGLRDASPAWPSSRRPAHGPHVASLSSHAELVGPASPRQRSRSRCGRVPDGSVAATRKVSSDLHGIRRAAGNFISRAAGRFPHGSSAPRHFSAAAPCSAGRAGPVSASTPSSTLRWSGDANMQLCAPDSVWSGFERQPVRLRPKSTKTVTTVEAPEGQRR